MKRSFASNFIRILVQISSFIFLIVSADLGNWFNSLCALAALLLTSIPQLISKWNNIKMPMVFTIVLILFMYAALYLGNLNSYYNRFPWWDNMLHTISCLSLSLVLFSYLIGFHQKSSKTNKLSPGMLIFVCFCFALACEAFWEITEFSADRLFGTDMQRWQTSGMSGLIDTMTDLIVGTLGAILAGVIEFIYLKKTKLISK